MGTCKAALDFHGQPLLLRMFDRLRDVCDGPRFVVAAVNQALPPLPEDVTVMQDRTPDRGPLEAVAVALRAAEEAHWDRIAMVSCDLPWLEPKLLELLDARFGAASDAIVVDDGVRRHPLLGIYRPSALCMADRLLSAGERSVQALLNDVALQTVGIKEVSNVDVNGHSLLNVNTPEEYERALAIREGEASAES